jgi:transmembrane sensor
MDYSKYATYTLQNFLDDDFFIQWVINPGEETDLFWNSVIDQFPDKKGTISQAAQIITTYRKQDTFYNEDRQALVWDRIKSGIMEQEAVKPRIIRMPQYLRIAAMLFLVSSIGLALWLYNKDRTVTTSYGEVRTVTLPDQSTVVLNGNSTIKYAAHWEKGPREVWINGEGFFKVRHINRDTLHIKTSERFIVHCSDVNIEVLGTTFNVKNRHNKTNVGLVNGKIRVDYFDSVLTSHNALVMKPGDYIEYAHKHLVEKRKLAEPVKITSWTQHLLRFNDATLDEITETLQDDYGYHVSLAEPSMAAMRIEGEINVTSVSELLETISTTLHVQVKQTDKTITIISQTP